MLRFCTQRQITALTRTSPLKLDTLLTLHGRSADELSRMAALILEDGSTSDGLRPNYASALHTAINNTSEADTTWINVTLDGVFFTTTRRASLPVVLRTSDLSAESEPPPIRRQGPIQSAIGDPAQGAQTSGDNVPQSETLHCLIDQSGSMASINNAAYEGAIELVNSMPEGAFISTSTFASSVVIGGRMCKSDALMALRGPRIANGSTALFDGIVMVIEEELRRPITARTTIVVVTDGQDNVSLRTNTDAREAVTRFQSLGAHNRVLFMGSNQDALGAAAAIGIPLERALTFGGSNQEHVRSAFRAASESAAAYRSTGEDGFTTVQRQRSVAN